MKILLVQLCFLFFFPFSGCELFTTREAEYPSGGSGSRWQFPRSPGVVIENLKNSLGRRSAAEYIRNFSDLPEGDVFRFIPDQETVVSFPGRFLDWDLERERKFSESIFAPSVLPNDSIASLEIVIEREILGTDSAEIVGQYELNLNHVLEDVPNAMFGQVQFSLVRNDEGTWAIRSWQDTRLSGFSCWSDLKASF